MATRYTESQRQAAHKAKRCQRLMLAGDKLFQQGSSLAMAYPNDLIALMRFQKTLATALSIIHEIRERAIEDTISDERRNTRRTRK